MIFRQESVERILAGTKTQTRRVPNGPCKYRVGADYSVQPGRGRREVARILISGIRRERLLDMSAGDLAREGFSHAENADAARAEFVNVWTQLHGSYDAQQLVDVIDFAVVSKRAA